MDAKLFTAVQIACQSLDNDELAAINNVAQAGWDPRNVKGHEKVLHLFTENGGTTMHPETQEALARIVLQRLAGKNA